MTTVRFCLALLVALRIALPATAAEKAPPPRELASDRALEELVRAIDRHFDEFWARNDITPAPLAADARAFIESKDPDKRTKKIDELLARPGHLNFFATVLRQTWVPQTMDNRQ